MAEFEVAPFGQYREQRVQNVQRHRDNETVADVRVPIAPEISVLASKYLIKNAATAILHKIGTNHNWDQDGVDQQTNHDDDRHKVLLLAPPPETCYGQYRRRQLIQAQVKQENDE